MLYKMIANQRTFFSEKQRMNLLLYDSKRKDFKSIKIIKLQTKTLNYTLETVEERLI